MSEEKVIQHAGKAIRVWQKKERGWFGKVKEFFVEILIIFFAVTITLLFHNWNDSLREHRQEREFLAGIKSDLDSGVVSLDMGIRLFQPTLDYFTNVRGQFMTGKINTAYLDSNSSLLTKYPGFGGFLASKLVGDPGFRYYIIHYSAYLQERKEHKQNLILRIKKMSAEIREELDK